MIRISIHLMSDPADVLLSETEHELMMYRDAGDRLQVGVTLGGLWLPLSIDEATLERWLEKERAEAMVP
jgi:hypothetical protein